MKNIVLYFGSFNPIHTAHLSIASHMSKLCDEVWLVISPQNPHKESSILADENHRLKMATDAIETINKDGKIKICTIEFLLSRPSYTYQTLRELRRTNPNTNFSIVIGSDNLQSLDHWKNHEEILSQTPFFVYPRDGYIVEKEKYATRNITYLDDAKKMAISSTVIRTNSETNNNILSITKEYITKHNLYK